MGFIVSPKTRLLIFVLLIGITIILAFALAEIKIPYFSKYLILVSVITFYFLIAIFLGKYRRKY